MSGIFDMLLREVAKFDSTMTESKIFDLNTKIDKIYLKKINTYLKLNLREVPNLATYKVIEQMVLDQTTLDSKIKKKRIENSFELTAFIERKKSSQEWIQLSDHRSGPYDFFLTDHGIYETSNNKVIGLALFNQADLKIYKENNGTITDILKDFNYVPTLGCYKMIRNFFR